MGFNNKRIVCDGEKNLVFSNDANEEGIVNSLIVYNSLKTEQIVRIYIDNLLISEVTCPKSDTIKFIDKLNIGVGSSVSVKGEIGVIVTVSFIKQVVDLSTAKTVAKGLVEQAETIKNGLSAQLPDGAISDNTTSADTTYSSVKILELMHNDEALPPQSAVDTAGKVLISNGLKSKWVSSVTLGVDCGGASNDSIAVIDAGSASSFN